MYIKKILAFTGIRSDYDLMSMLYKNLNKQSDIEIKLIVSGAHLSDTYGYTYKNIEADNIPILCKIENLIDSNSKASRLKSLSILLQNCIHNIVDYSPDLIIYAGDREEVIVGGLVGAYLRIPTIHFFGGDHASDGNVDNLIRHATSKLSSIHFVSSEDSKNRLIKLGEASNRIFNVGSPAIDNFMETPIISKNEVLKELGKEDWDNYAVVIFHPILGEEDNAGIYFEQILKALIKKNIYAFISYPNVDSGNRKIISIIESYSENNNFKFYKNLPRILFVNMLRYSSFLIGNSSSGLAEAPVLKLGAINVGLRQKGRLSSGNVIFVEQEINEIMNGIDKVLSKDFKDSLSKVKSLYGDGKSVDKIVQLIKTIDFDKYVKKCEDPNLQEDVYE